MHQAPSDAGLTFKVLGSITPGNHINDYPLKSQIQWQELFAILAATLRWGHKWQRKRIRFNCDNQAIRGSEGLFQGKLPSEIIFSSYLQMELVQIKFSNTEKRHS